MSSFTAPFTLSFYVALGITLPYLLWEIWGYVAPGLYKHEKRFAFPLFISSVILFYVGMAFCFFLLFPSIFQFLVATTPRGVKMQTDIADYVSFAMTMFLSFGLAFEVPIVVILLVLTGLVKIDRLTSSRGYVIIAIFVIAAVITPTTDAISQVAMAGPMWLLYEGGVIAARLMLKMKRQGSDEGEAPTDNAQS
jgi:sec-independent protein translocase protein TatC